LGAATVFFAAIFTGALVEVFLVVALGAEDLDGAFFWFAPHSVQKVVFGSIGS
jgi:hypothetical protein